MPCDHSAVLEAARGCAVALAAAAWLAAAPAQSQEVSRAAGDHWTFSLYFENDLFADTDRRYTNGIKLSWVSPDLSDYRDSPELPPWSH